MASLDSSRSGYSTSSMASSRLGVSHLIEEGYRYPSRVELARSFTTTPVHPMRDILWSDNRKWRICLAGTLLSIVLFFFRRAPRTLEERLQFFINLAFSVAVLGVVVVVLIVFARLYNPAESIVKFFKKRLNRRRRSKKYKYSKVRKSGVDDVQNTLGLSKNARRYRPQPPSSQYPGEGPDVNGKERAMEKQRWKFNQELVEKNEDFKGLEYKEEEATSEDEMYYP